MLFRFLGGWAAATPWTRRHLLAVAIGPEGFADFLAGFNAMDRHFVRPGEER